MRFERHARFFCGPLDPAPVMGVMMLLMIFMLLGSLLYTPGVTIELPQGAGWSGTENPTVAVAMDSDGQCFFENKAVQEAELLAALTKRAQSTAQQGKKLTLVLWADKSAELQRVTHLELLARQAGITEVTVAQRPTAFGPRP